MKSLAIFSISLVLAVLLVGGVLAYSAQGRIVSATASPDFTTNKPTEKLVDETDYQKSPEKNYKAEAGDMIQLPMGKTVEVEYEKNGKTGKVFVTMVEYRGGERHNGDAKFRIRQILTDGSVQEQTLIINPDNSIGFILEVFKTSDMRSVISIPVSRYLD